LAEVDGTGEREGYSEALTYEGSFKGVRDRAREREGRKLAERTHGCPGRENAICHIYPECCTYQQICGSRGVLN
jgi:hypothetical protein